MLTFVKQCRIVDYSSNTNYLFLFHKEVLNFLRFLGLLFFYPVLSKKIVNQKSPNLVDK